MPPARLPERGEIGDETGQYETVAAAMTRVRGPTASAIRTDGSRPPRDGTATRRTPRRTARFRQGSTLDGCSRSGQ